MSSRPTAAAAIFPYPTHRTMAEVARQERMADRARSELDAVGSEDRRHKVLLGDDFDQEDQVHVADMRNGSDALVAAMGAAR